MAMDKSVLEDLKAILDSAKGLEKTAGTISDTYKKLNDEYAKATKQFEKLDKQYNWTNELITSLQNLGGLYKLVPEKIEELMLQMKAVDASIQKSVKTLSTIVKKQEGIEKRLSATIGSQDSTQQIDKKDIAAMVSECTNDIKVSIKKEIKDAIKGTNIKNDLVDSERVRYQSPEKLFPAEQPALEAKQIAQPKSQKTEKRTQREEKQEQELKYHFKAKPGTTVLKVDDLTVKINGFIFEGCFEYVKEHGEWIGNRGNKVAHFNTKEAADEFIKVCEQCGIKAN